MKNILYLGLFSARYGYGEASRGYKAIIEHEKWPVKCIDMTTLEGWKHLTSINLSNKTLILHKRPTNDLRPREIEILSRAKRLVYLTVWECRGIPNTWKPWLDSIKEIIVPSEYCASVFREEWPTKKIYVLPHMLNPFMDMYRFSDIPQDKINVLSIVSQLTGRKGIDNVISGFYCLPREVTDKCRLIVKGTKGTVEFCKRMIIEHNKPDIIAKDDYMTDEDMDRLMYSCDVLFAPNRGEGFGIDIVRGSMLGVDIVATGAGGYMDHVKDLPNFFPIEYSWDCAYCKSTYHDTDVTGLTWPSPNIKQCRDALEFCIRGAIHKDYNINATNQKIQKYNEMVIEQFKDILENIK